MAVTSLLVVGNACVVAQKPGQDSRSGPVRAEREALLPDMVIRKSAGDVDGA